MNAQPNSPIETMNSSEPHSAMPPSEHTLRPSIDVVVSTHQRLVERVAHRLRRRLPKHAASVEVGDLVAAGFVGLLDARGRFGWSRPDDFAKYAEFRVKGAMLDELRRLDPAPRGARRAYRHVERTRDRLSRELGHRAVDRDVAAQLGVSEREVGEVRLAAGPGSFDDIDGYAEILPSEGGDPHSIVERRVMAKAVRQAVKALPGRQRDLLTAFHLRGEKLTTIAQRMGVTVGRASQIKSEAMVALRITLREHGGAVAEER